MAEVLQYITSFGEGESGKAIRSSIYHGSYFMSAEKIENLDVSPSGQLSKRSGTKLLSKPVINEPDEEELGNIKMIPVSVNGDSVVISISRKGIKISSQNSTDTSHYDFSIDQDDAVVGSGVRMMSNPYSTAKMLKAQISVITRERYPELTLFSIPYEKLMADVNEGIARCMIALGKAFESIDKCDYCILPDESVIITHHEFAPIRLVIGRKNTLSPLSNYLDVTSSIVSKEKLTSFDQAEKGYYLYQDYTQNPIKIEISNPNQWQSLIDFDGDLFYSAFNDKLEINMSMFKKSFDNWQTNNPQEFYPLEFHITISSLTSTESAKYRKIKERYPLLLDFGGVILILACETTSGMSYSSTHRRSYAKFHLSGVINTATVSLLKMTDPLLNNLELDTHTTSLNLNSTASGNNQFLYDHFRCHFLAEEPCKAIVQKGLYPSKCEFFQGRIWFAGFRLRPMNIISSNVLTRFDERINFVAGSTASSAIDINLHPANSDSEILFLSGKGDLKIYTDTAQYILSDKTSAGLTPAGLQSSLFSAESVSTTVKPTVMGNITYTLSASHTQVIRIMFDDRRNSFTATPLLKFANPDFNKGDVVSSGVIKPSEKVPQWRIIICNSTQNYLKVIHFDEATQLSASSTYTTNGKYLSVASSGTKCYLSIRRNISNNKTMDCIEYFDDEAMLDGEAIRDVGGVTGEDLYTSSETEEMDIYDAEGKKLSSTSDSLSAYGSWKYRGYAVMPRFISLPMTVHPLANIPRLGLKQRITQLGIHLVNDTSFRVATIDISEDEVSEKLKNVIVRHNGKTGWDTLQVPTDVSNSRKLYIRQEKEDAFDKFNFSGLRFVINSD